MYSFVILAANALGDSQSGGDGLASQIGAFFDYIIGRIPSWGAGVIVFIVSFGLAKIAKSAVESRISDKIDEEHQEVLILAGRVTYFATLVLGVTIALKIAGIDLTTILAAVAFGIGFALQDLIMNFLSGVMILLNRQFTIGDFIKVGNTVGKVVEIQTRATILKAIDGTKVIVPNADIFRNQVVSFTTNPTRRVSIPVYVSYDTDLKFATKIALEVLHAHPKILKKPGPSIIIKDYGDSEIDLEARFWVGSKDGWITIKSEVMHKMLQALDAAGISIPYNITHIETSADTREYEESATKIRQQKMVEMNLSKAIEAENKVNQTPAPVTTAAPVTAAPATAAAPVAPASAIVTPGTPSTTDPAGAYEDLTEIDGQA